VGGLALGVTGLASAADPTPSPSTVSPDHPGRHAGPGERLERGLGRGGLVTAVTPATVTVQTPAGPKTIGLGSGTTYYADRTKATKAILTVGDIVGIRLADPKAASPVAAVVTVLPAHLEGFVTKVDGSTITLTDESGFTRTVRTSSATTYEKAGAAGKASDVTVGAFVRARGAVDADGTTLDATTVSTGRPARGDHGPRGDGPMGSGPMGDGPMGNGPTA
jgi:hypothetical protein